MLQVEEESKVLEIKGYKRYRAGIIFDLIFCIPIMWLFGMLCIDTIRSFSLLSIPICGFTALMTWLIIYVFHYYRILVIRLEPIEGGFRATTLLNETKQFHPDQVREIQDAYAHIVLVFEDGNKLDFAKTFRFYFNGHYQVWDDHLWTPFFTSQRFPFAVHKTLRFPR